MLKNFWADLRNDFTRLKDHFFDTGCELYPILLKYAFIASVLWFVFQGVSVIGGGFALFLQHPHIAMVTIFVGMLHTIVGILGARLMYEFSSLGFNALKVFFKAHK